MAEQKFGDNRGDAVIRALLLAAALPFQPLPAPAFAPATPAPIVITPDNVDLDGAGTFDFTPDAKAFEVDPPAGGDGLSLVVRLWLDAMGRPVACDTGESPLPAAAQVGCAQLMRSARFHLVPGMALPLRRGFADVMFEFFKDVPSAPPGRHMFAFVVPGYTNTVVVYPPDETPADQLIHYSDGTLQGAVNPDDYPPRALRYGFESRSGVLLGISRDGRVQNCRPIIGSLPTRTAYLDNYTCELALKRWHFNFLPNAPAYDGLRYFRARVSWLMPGH